MWETSRVLSPEHEESRASFVRRRLRPPVCLRICMRADVHRRAPFVLALARCHVEHENRRDYVRLSTRLTFYEFAARAGKRDIASALTRRFGCPGGPRVLTGSSTALQLRILLYVRRCRASSALCVVARVLGKNRDRFEKLIIAHCRSVVQVFDR